MYATLPAIYSIYLCKLLESDLLIDSNVLQHCLKSPLFFKACCCTFSQAQIMLVLCLFFQEFHPVYA